MARPVHFWLPKVYRGGTNLVTKNVPPGTIFARYNFCVTEHSRRVCPQLPADTGLNLSASELQKLQETDPTLSALRKVSGREVVVDQMWLDVQGEGTDRGVAREGAVGVTKSVS